MEQTEFNRPKRKKKRKNKSKNNALILNIILCVIALGALTGCMILLLQNHRLKQQEMEVMAEVPEMEEEQPTLVLEPELMEKTFTEEEVQEIAEALAQQAAGEASGEVLGKIKQQLVDGEDFSAILRDLYTDELVVIAEGNYYFIPISETLKKHSYETEQFILDDKEILTYQDESGNTLSQKGIDVSRYQNDIDWSKVAGDGVDFAFIRLGIRGSSEGTLVLDTTYEQNMKGAAANGIDTGVYFFTQALDEKEAVEEAEFVLENLQDYDITYPVVLDVEAIETKNPRTKDMTREEWTKVTIAFCERIKEAGYTPMIYGNLRTFLLMLDMEQLEQYEKWFAFFRTPLYFPYEHSVWQYTSKGKVDGIKGDVDLNICMKDLKRVDQNE